jgi:uncharacterized protein (TIGR03083 family)
VFRIVDQQAACAGGEEITRAYVQLLRSASRPGAVAVGEWTVGETAAHTAHVFETYARASKTGTFPISATTSLNDHWAGELAQDSDRNPGTAADRIEAAAAEIWPAYRKLAADEIVEWYAGIKVPAFTPPSIMITEAAVHGWDVAQAEDLPWSIDADVARLSIQGLYPLLPHFVNEAAAAGLRTCFELRLRGGPPAYLTFENAVLSVGDTPPRPVDCRISVDPVAYLLVGYGRIGQWGQTLQGKVLVWGRKPWLGLKLGKLIANP